MIAHRMGIGLAILFTASTLQSCDFPHACALSVEPAIVVTIVDSSTGVPLADSAVAIVRRDGVVDTLVPYGVDSAGRLTSLVSPGIGAGVYDVIVTRENYDSWSDKVLVRKGGCGIATQALTARLERASAP
jgi:hypothetical protein